MDLRTESLKFNPVTPVFAVAKTAFLRAQPLMSFTSFQVVVTLLDLQWKPSIIRLNLRCDCEFLSGKPLRDRKMLRAVKLDTWFAVPASRDCGVLLQEWRFCICKNIFCICVCKNYNHRAIFAVTASSGTQKSIATFCHTAIDETRQFSSALQPRYKRTWSQNATCFFHSHASRSL